jgi:selenocysteine lyase/cysteine desulfurase
VRRKLAVEVGCDQEELAITRNASEGLQIVQLGIDLQPGDHVVTTNQDYGRMLDTWDQRVRRDRFVVGTGFLYVRRENIAKVWPLTPAAASKSDNIRKFEEIGTHPAANHNAIAEALAFHQAIGVERKAARLRYLNDRWAKRVEKLPGVKILNSREPNQAWGLFNVSLERVDAPKAYDFLWTKYRIITAAIKRDDYQGLRVTPNVYTTLEEIDTFAGAIEDLLKNGTPSTAA